ncbi:unnamed protein product [Closterium sp. NIES-53]
MAGVTNPPALLRPVHPAALLPCAPHAPCSPVRPARTAALRPVRPAALCTRHARPPPPPPSPPSPAAGAAVGEGMGVAGVWNPLLLLLLRLPLLQLLLRGVACFALLVVLIIPHFDYGVQSFSLISSSILTESTTHLLRTQWLTCDAAARRSVALPLEERVYFGQLKTAKELYDAVVARYSSSTAALGRIMLPYLHPELSDCHTVADLMTHLRSSVVAAVPLSSRPFWLRTRLQCTSLSTTSLPTSLTPSTPLGITLKSFPCGKTGHTEYRCFCRLEDAWRTEYGYEQDIPNSVEGDCYSCVPRAAGIEAAALGACESAAAGTAYAEALHTFPLDSGASRCFFRDCTTVTPLIAHVSVSLADPSGGPVVAQASTVLPCPAVPSGSLSGLHIPSFSTNLNLLWHHHLGHPSLPRLRGIHLHLLVSGLSRSLPPLPRSLALPCLPCVEGRQRAAPHSSSFLPTTAPLRTLHMDVWGPAHVHGQDQERYFLLVVDDYTRYTTVFPLRSKADACGVLIDWIIAVRRQLSARFQQDLQVL